MKLVCFVFCLSCLFGNSIFSQSQSNTRKVSFLQSRALEGASVSALAVNLSTKDTLFEINSKQRLIPASVQKLFTTAAALEVLGLSYQYSTKIYADGAVEGNLLKGNLNVVGGGDPTLGSALFSTTAPDSVFNKIYIALRGRGITQIEGNIVVVDTFFNHLPLPSGRLYEDMANYYGAAPQSLSWRDNSFKLFLSSNSTPNSLCKIIGTDPFMPNLDIECTAVGSLLMKDSAYIYPLNNKLIVRGSIPFNKTSFTIKGVLPSPANSMAYELVEYLKVRGVAVKKSSSTKSSKAPKTTTLLTEIASPYMSEIVKETNRKSINLFADALYLTMAKSVKSNSLWDGGAVFLSSFWNSLIGSPLLIEDGCGLSPRNLISASQIVSALCYCKNAPFSSSFINSLAVAGVSGTLKNSFPQYTNKLYGKSGSMKNVLCYAGYYIDTKSDTIAFAVMVNNFVCEQKVVKVEIEGLIGR